MQTTLLQTAICVILNPPYPEKETKVRVVLDQGSQRSYITNQLKEKLNLPILGKENMIIKTFGAGSNEDSITVCDVASMKIKNPKSGFSIDLNLLTVPLICSPLQGQAVKCGKENYPHLENLDLAEGYTAKSELEVSVLLGADHVWKVIKGEVRPGGGGGDTRLPNCCKYRIKMGIKWHCWKHAKSKTIQCELNSNICFESAKPN